jgi:hypothetical protein
MQTSSAADISTSHLPCLLQGNDAFYRQPYHQLRHPMVFYYVHPAVLYINKFRVAGLLDEGIDQFIEQVRAAVMPTFESLK